MDADALDSFRIIRGAAQGTQQLGGNASAECKLRHALHAAERRDGHDSRDNGHVNACQLTAFAKIVEIMVIEEELGADIVRSGVDFGLEVIHLFQPVWSVRMTLRKSGDANPKTSAVRMHATLIEPANEGDQLRSMLKGIGFSIVVLDIARRIAA